MNALSDADLDVARGPARVRVRGGARDAGEWAHANRAAVEALLDRQGAVHVVGLRLGEPHTFERFARALCPALHPGYRDLPSIEGSEALYAATPYPSSQSILFHNKGAHLAHWPQRQFFWCVEPARDGGETRLADGRLVWGALPPGVRVEFARRRLSYLRTFHPSLAVPWQRFFGTDDRSKVERECEDEGMAFEWLGGDVLRVRRDAPAVIVHPRTREPVWFNQIQLHHQFFLDARTRGALFNLFPARDMRPRHVRFADGAEIDDAVLAEIRAVLTENAVGLTMERGDVVLLDNLLIAHSRGPYVGPRRIVVALGAMCSKRELPPYSPDVATDRDRLMATQARGHGSASSAHRPCLCSHESKSGSRTARSCRVSRAVNLEARAPAA